ncbi:MAG: tetratricopeptide repeat protein [Deltaproteobacteria bacterium]|nr:tetratricopeptide repeat protein [Deltaproteobacteria bacterium]
MSRENLKKYVELLNNHLEFIAEIEIEGEEDGKHLEDVIDAISEIAEYLDSSDSEKEDTEISSALEEKDKEIKALQKSLKETREILDTELPEDMMKKLKKKLRKENEEKAGEEIRNLKKQIEDLENNAGNSNTQSDEELEKANLEIKKLTKELEELKSGVDEKIDTAEIEKKVKSQISKEYEKKVADLEKKLAEKSVESTAAVECAEEENEGPTEKPEDKDDIEGWELYLEENPDDEDAVANVKRIEKEARANRDHGKLADVLICRFNAGMFETDEEGTQLIKEVAQIQEIELDNTEEALLAIKVIFELKPEDDSLLADLKRLAITGNHWDLYVDELVMMIPDVRSSEVAARLYLEAGKACNERLGNPRRAVELFERAHSVDPKNGEVLDELAGIQKKNEDWETLIKTLKKRINISDDSHEKAFYLREIARIQNDRLKDNFLAAATYEEVFSLVPDDMESILALEVIYRKHELFEQLASLLNRKIESVESAEEARMARRELGFLYAKELDDHSRAIDILEHLLEVMTTDLEMMRLLKDLYEGSGRMRGYMKMASMIAEKTDDVEEKVNLYKRMAAEYLLNPTMRSNAAENYERVILLRPEEEDIYSQLEDIYESEEQYEELCATLRKHSEVLHDNIPKSKILRKLGKTLLNKMKDIDGAVSVLEESQELKGNSADTWKLLGSAYMKNDDYSSALEYLEKLSEDTDGEERAIYLKDAGKCLFNLGELEKAEDYLQKANAALSNDSEILEILGDTYYEMGQWTRSVNYLEKALDTNANEKEKSALVFKAASIYSDKLEDLTKAVVLYEKLIELIPGHDKATRILAEHYYNISDWEKAAPLLHVIVTEIGDMPKHDKVEMFLKAGKVALSAGDIEKAASYLEKARELEPTSLDVLLELAELRDRREEWDGALSLYQALLVAHRDNLSSIQVAEIYTKLGKIKEIKGDTVKAVSFYDKALEFHPGCNDAAEAVVRLRTDSQDYEKVAKIKLGRIEKEEDLDKKLELISELIRFYIDTAKDPDSAIELQEEAISLKPGDRGVLNDALDLYHLTERWDKVVSTVLKLADLEEPGLLRSKYHYSAALIYAEEMGDENGALEQFEVCLEQDSENEEVFERIIQIHKKREDWHSLVRSIRKQMKRNSALQKDVNIWETLGEVYMEQMGDMDTALAAFEAAANLSGDTEKHLRLADLYIQAGPQHLDKAQSAYMKVLSEEPQNIDLIRKLFDISIAKQDKDLTWNLCGVLAMYNQASDKEKLFYDKYAGKGLAKATSILNDDEWLLLSSDGEDNDLNMIFRALGYFMALYEAKPHSVWGFNRKNRVDIDKDKRDWVRAYEYVSKTLLIKVRPELFESEGLPLRVQLANTREDNALLPSWKVDVKAFQKMDQMQSAYYFARELAYLRPERFYRRAAATPTSLFNSLYAVLELTVPGKIPSLPDDRKSEVQKIMEHLRNAVPAATLESTKPFIEKFSTRDIDNSVARWINANARTSLRAATLITGELKHTVAMTLDEQDNITGIKSRDRVSEILKFVLSPEYYELRKAIGLAIK